MLETNSIPQEETKNHKGIPRRLFLATLERIREGINSKRISIKVDTDSIPIPIEEIQDPTEYLSDFIQTGGIIICNHTEAGNSIHKLMQHTSLGGSTPLDALVLVEMVNEARQRLREKGIDSPIPMMLQRVNFNEDPTNIAKTARQIQHFQEAVSDIVQLVSVTPGISNGINLGAMKKAINHVKEGGILILFPEGEGYPAGEDLESHTVYEGAIWISQKTGKPIMPVYAKGTESYTGTLGLGGRTQEGNVEVYLGPKCDPGVGSDINSWREIVRMQDKYDLRVKSGTPLKQ